MRDGEYFLPRLPDYMQTPEFVEYPADLIVAARCSLNATRFQ